MPAGIDGPLIERRDGGVLWLRLNRPQVLNAIDRALGLALVAAIERAGDDPSVRAVVLIGEGRAFCAGDDIAGLKAFLEGDVECARAAVDPHDRTALYLRIAVTMRTCPKPVIAAINGSAFGAGTEVLCAADLRCMARSARVGSGLVRIGEVGNAAFLGQVVGPERAFEIFVSGRAVAADEALAIGLVHYVYEDADFEAGVAALAHGLAVMPTRVIGLQKQLRERARGRSTADCAALQEEAHRVCFREIEDAREGARAFLEKRAPLFCGR